MSNYVQLGGALLLGLVLVPLIVAAMGTDGYGLIGLMGASVGIAMMVEEIVRRAMVRELGEAHHSGDPQRFSETYNAAQLLSAAAAAITVAVFGVLIALLPVITHIQSPALLAAARWFLLIKAIESFVVVVAAPAISMYLVTERFVPYNALNLLIAACWPVAAGCVLLSGELPVHRAVVQYVSISSGLVITLNVLGAVAILGLDRRLVPSPRRATAEAARRVLRMGFWNVVVSGATSLHLRLDIFIMHWAFAGLLGNAVFDPAVRLTTYLRLAVTGMTRGTDALAARMSSVAASSPLETLVRHTTRLHGLVAFPLGVMLALMGRPMIELWIAPHLDHPRAVVLAITLVPIMTLGAVFRSVSDGWLFVFYGAGHIRRYAPLVLVGGLCNPLLAIGLLWLLPPSVRYTGPAWSYTVVFGVVHVVLVPLVTVRAIGMTYGQLLAPLGRPLLAAAAAAPGLWLWARLIEHWTAPKLVGALGSYGLLYGLLVVVVVMSRQERLLAAAFLKRRMGVNHDV